MMPDFLPLMGLLSQIAGAVLLFLSGGLGLNRPYRPRGTATGLALFCAGSVSLALFAGYERNFLLTGTQTLAMILIFLGVRRKTKGKDSGQ